MRRGQHVVTTGEYAELGQLCRQTAQEVGERVLRWRRERSTIASDTKSSPTDAVTEADRLAERLIRERLMTARPDAAWWGEESGRAASAADAGSPAGGHAGLEWVVDPIDGTTSFLYDLPGWAVSIAAREDGQSVAAAVHVPTLGLTFTAEHGGGSFVDDSTGRRALAASTENDLSMALIATGFNYDAVVRTRQGAIVGQLVGRVRDIRRAGAASVDLCAVAAGRVDAYFEWGLEPWDLAAGSLIAEEAGAVVYQRPSGTTVAAGPAIASALEQLLSELGD
jgi:myo-inositol-1(or 4)-monophosphatase